MQEILPGVFHWTAHHDHIDARVSSYYVEPAGAFIDPKLPEEEGLAALRGRQRPEQVILTSGHHARDAARFAHAFRIPIRASLQAADHLAGTLKIEPYNRADEVAPGIRAIEIGIIAPDEWALHVAVAEGALAIADAINTYGGSLGFFSDDLLGAHPDRVKEGIKNRFRALLERDFDHLLPAHGEPIVGHAKARLRDFVTSPVGHPEYGQVL